MTEPTIAIPQSEYESLLEDRQWLQCLESAGVDNWSGYEYAKDLMSEQE